MRQHILVTGAASGIGFATSRIFAEQGADVTLVDFRATAVSQAAHELRHLNQVRISQIVADLREIDAPAAVVREAWSLAPVDVLVNVAGIYPSAPFLDLDAQTWDAVQNINVRAPMLAIVALSRLAIEAKRGASIINISSTAAQRSRPGSSAYSTSKASVDMLTSSAALELGPHGIRVNAVAPGFIPVASDVNPVTDEYSSIVSTNPLGRPGSARDIAQAVAWLAGPDTSWMTGTILRVDGGSSTGSHTLPHSWHETLVGVTDDNAS